MNYLKLIAFTVLLLCGREGISQSNNYILNGAAQQISCNCYSLTPETLTQSGSVWNANKINLNNPFDFWFNVYLGCRDGDGADGIVFILQPISTSIGTTGGGMGFEGLTPSIGIALDTYQNGLYNDPVFDHISIQANGNLNHSSDLAGPIQASAVNANIEDCNWHTLRISWDPATKWLRTYFDGILRVETQVNMVANIFNNDPNVYWGFSGATGGLANVQKFCTALNPGFTTNLTADGSCPGTPIQFSDRSESFAPLASYYWNFGDGNTSTAAQPPPHVYAQAGVYQVKYAIKALDGCASDTLSKTITIGSVPQASIDVADTCFGSLPRLNTGSGQQYGVSYQWLLDGSPNSTTSQPQLGVLPVGNHSLSLAVTSDYSCGLPASGNADFVIKPRPDIDAVVEDGCLGDPVQFSAQPDPAVTVAQWHWDFGDNRNSSLASPEHTYAQTGFYDVRLWGLAANGCYSDTASKKVSINQAKVFAGRDTLVLPNIPFRLQATGNGSFSWSPATGLSATDLPDPVVTPTTDRTYLLTVTTAEGCVATDQIVIELFKGSAIHVPSGFTPNYDGKNDLFRPHYTGIKKLYYLNVYNRWGQQVFSTTDLQKGWNGETGGKPSATGTFVWMLKAEDLAGKTYQLKGTITLIR
jgi:gliding motility-associated-like protein